MMKRATPLAPVAAQAGEVRHREIHQQQRIYAGVRNGTIGLHEYRQLQRGEDRLDDLRARDLKDGDGLSRREYVQLNRDENRLSRRIYRDRHDRH